MKLQKLVTKEWLVAKIALQPEHVIGRALVAIYNEQTQEEQQVRATKFHNGVGFSKPDASIGTRSAKTFIATGTLEPWQLNIWMRTTTQGYPRIVKYAEQLNQIANRKLLHNGN